MGVEIHPAAYVSDGANLGENVSIGPGCVIGNNVVLGDRVKLLAHVSIDGHTQIGVDSLIYPFAALGYPPQDLKYKGEDTKLFIGANTTIREHVTMHLGTVTSRGETRVGDNGYFMVGSHVGHDCIVGDNVVFANNATLGGSVVVGEHVIMGGLSAVHQFCRVGRHAFIGGGAPVTGDVIPYGMVDNHGDLAGLNLVGLKRRGFDREAIHDMRTAYRLFFASEGTFQERVDDAAGLYKDHVLVSEMVEFLRAGNNRPLCLPN
ncbi:MAG: acyl-ACP--UDP-N-acetylglucosamine O-acyltransferase [Pseudomonadota bacterium]